MVKVDTAVIKVYGTYCQTERTVVACVGPLLTLVLVEKVNGRYTSLYSVGLQNFLRLSLHCRFHVHQVLHWHAVLGVNVVAFCGFLNFTAMVLLVLFIFNEQN